MPNTRLGRDVLLVIIVLVGLGVLARDDASWFPPSWAPGFYILKAMAGLVAVITTVIHMSLTWPHVGDRARRLRYLLLLGFVMVVASASTAQYDAGAPATGRNVAGLVLAILATPVALLSIREDNHRYRS